MQKNKTKYDQIIKNFDKLTFDSLLDIMIPESADGKIPSAKEVEFKKYLIETNPSFLKEIGSKLKTLNKLSKDIYKFNFVDLPKQNKENIGIGAKNLFINLPNPKILKGNNIFFSLLTVSKLEIFKKFSISGKINEI